MNENDINNNNFLRLQVLSKFYERTGNVYECNQSKGSYRPLLKDMAEALGEGFEYQTANSANSPNRIEIEENGSTLSTVSIMNLYGGSNVNSNAYNFLFRYTTNSNLKKFKTQNKNIQLFKTLSHSDINAWQSLLKENKIDSRNTWEQIRNTVKNSLQKSTTPTKFCYLLPDGADWLEAILTGNTPEPIIYTFFETLSIYADMRRQAINADREVNISSFKGKYNNLKDECVAGINAAKKRLERARFPDKIDYERQINKYERRLKQILVKEYASEFKGTEIKTSKATYVLEKLIHGGDFSAVWSATATEKDGGKTTYKAVLKMLRNIKNASYNNQITEGVEVQKEIFTKIAETEKDYGIVEILDGPYQEEGFTFYIMEYVEGQTLETWLKKNKDHKEFIKNFKIIFERLCHLVDSLHKQEIQHLDLCPSNIYIADDNRVILSDFDNVQSKGTHYNSFNNYMEMADKAFASKLLLQNKLTKAEAVQADIYACTRIFINGFLMNINKADDWEGSHHNNNYLIEGPRFEGYKDEFKTILHQGTAHKFSGISDLSERIKSGDYRQKIITKKHLKIASIILSIFTLLGMIGMAYYYKEFSKELKNGVKGFGYFTMSDNRIEDMNKIDDFLNVYEGGFRNRMDTILINFSDSTQNSSIFFNGTLPAELAVRPDTNYLKFTPVSTSYKYALGWSNWLSTKADRNSLDTIQLTNKANKFFGAFDKFLQEKADTTTQELPVHIARIVNFKEDTKFLKPILIYAVYENSVTKDSIMYSYPYYQKDFSDFNFPDRPWYQAPINDNEFGYTDLSKKIEINGWKVGITNPYSDFKKGYLPIRTLFFEKRVGSSHYLLLIDFIYLIDKSE